MRIATVASAAAAMSTTYTRHQMSTIKAGIRMSQNCQPFMPETVAHGYPSVTGDSLHPERGV